MSIEVLEEYHGKVLIKAGFLRKASGQGSTMFDRTDRDHRSVLIGLQDKIG
jgi:hypothetical protein